MQQMNLAFVVDRLEKLNLTLMLGSEKSLSELEGAWDAKLLRRMGEVWISLPELVRCQDDIPEIASLMLTHMVECKEVSACQFTIGALNRLRQMTWRDEVGGWQMLWLAVRNLALNCLEEDIQEQDVHQLLETVSSEQGQGKEKVEQGSLLTDWLNLPLRDARDAFEKYYFEIMLNRESGNMTRVAEQSGLERTHLYRKLKQLGVATGRRNEE
jgi:DNA-binding NtrC family response regulator